jgi:hypothetical protein
LGARGIPSEQTIAISLYFAGLDAEAAANILTNPQLDPWGKIPEFKYCAARVEALAIKEAVE